MKTKDDVTRTEEAEKASTPQHASTNEKAAATPGPWEVVRHSHVDGELWLSVNQHADAAGMKEWIAEIKYLITDNDRQWANARLIAAAPDLLAACKAAHVFIRNGVALGYIRMPDADCPDPAHATPEMIRAAIAKAEGR